MTDEHGYPVDVEAIRASAWQGSEEELDHFRVEVKEACSSEAAFLVVNYHVAVAHSFSQDTQTSDRLEVYLFGTGHRTNS